MPVMERKRTTPGTDPSLGIMTVRDLSKRFDVSEWSIRRAIDRSGLGVKFGTYRVVRAEDLPAFERALVECGYIEPTAKGA